MRRMSTMLGNYVAPIPAQQRIDKSWYQGSAEEITFENDWSS